MDGFPDNSNPGNLKKESETHVEIPQNTDEHTLSGIDPHSLIERRITELWEKLEETTDNLNSCDDILETYFQTVAEKMKENRCPNCNKEVSSKEAEEPYEIITSISGNPKSLMQEISSSLLEIEKFVKNNSISNAELMLEEGTTTLEKVNDGAIFPSAELCRVLQEVLFKLKNLESRVVAPHRIEPVNFHEGNGAEEKHKEEFLKTAVADESALEERDIFPFPNDESEISSRVMIFYWRP